MPRKSRKRNPACLAPDASAGRIAARDRQHGKPPFHQSHTPQKVQIYSQFPRKTISGIINVHRRASLFQQHSSVFQRGHFFLVTLVFDLVSTDFRTG